MSYKFMLLRYHSIKSLAQLVRARRLLIAATYPAQTMLHFFHRHTLYQPANTLKITATPASKTDISYNSVTHLDFNLSTACTLCLIYRFHNNINPIIYQYKVFPINGLFHAGKSQP